MKFEFDPRTGRMGVKPDPQKEILQAVRRDASVEKGQTFPNQTTIREGLVMCRDENGTPYCVVRLNGQWRCIGRVVDQATIRRRSYGPLIDFHLAWQSGTPVANPLRKPDEDGDSDSDEE